MTKITDEELARELFGIVKHGSNLGLNSWENTGTRSAFIAAAHRARFLLQSSWPDPIPIVTGEEVTYPCIAFDKNLKRWLDVDCKQVPSLMLSRFSHFIPMPPAPVIDPFEEEWKAWLADGRAPGTSKEVARNFWDAALKSKEGK